MTIGRQFYFSFILLDLGFNHVLSSSLPHIWSSIDGYKTVCKNEQVYLICSANNSWTLSWLSPEYIGERTSIQFDRDIDRLGDGKFVSLSNGRATLSQMTKTDSEASSLSSDLRIQIPNNFSRTEVACVNENSDRETRTFILAEEPPQPPEFLPIETVAENSTRGTIVYRVRWGFPKDLESTDLSYFELQVDDQQPFIVSNNTNETVIHLQYGLHSFSIVAVDRCNQRSQRTTCTLDHAGTDPELTKKVHQDENPINGYEYSSASGIEMLSTTIYLIAACFSFLFL